MNVTEGGCADDGRPSTVTYEADIKSLLGYLAGLDGGVAVPYLEAWNKPNSSGVSASQAAAYWVAADADLSRRRVAPRWPEISLITTPTRARRSSTPDALPNLTYNNHLKPYEDNYVTALGSARPAIWGFHPYEAVNCAQPASLTNLESNLPHPGGADLVHGGGSLGVPSGASATRQAVQQSDASYLVNTLMASPEVISVFYYEFAAFVYTQSCSKYADSALYEANTAPGFMYARPAAATILPNHAGRRHRFHPVPTSDHAV